MQKYCYIKLWVLSFLVCSGLLIADVFADSIYWRRPIKDTNLYLPQTNLSVFPVGKNGESVALSKEEYTPYFYLLETFGEFMLNRDSREVQHVLAQGEMKSSDDILLTFYLNNCFALIVNTEDRVYMLHGRPTDHPAFPEDVKRIREELSSLEGEFYLISHQVFDLIKYLPKDKKLYIHRKIKNLINTVKVTKIGKELKIEAEFHPNAWVDRTNFEKFLAYMPWGPLGPVTFKSIW